MRIWIGFLLLTGCASSPADVYLRGRYGPDSKVTMDSVELDRLLLREAENRLLKERLSISLKELGACTARKELEAEAEKVFGPASVAK